MIVIKDRFPHYNKDQHAIEISAISVILDDIVTSSAAFLAVAVEHYELVLPLFTN